MPAQHVCWSCPGGQLPPRFNRGPRFHFRGETSALPAPQWPRCARALPRSQQDRAEPQCPPGRQCSSVVFSCRCHADDMPRAQTSGVSGNGYEPAAQDVKHICKEYAQDGAAHLCDCRAADALQVVHANGRGGSHDIDVHKSPPAVQAAGRAPRLKQSLRDLSKLRLPQGEACQSCAGAMSRQPVLVRRWPALES